MCILWCRAQGLDWKKIPKNVHPFTLLFFSILPPTLVILERMQIKLASDSWQWYCLSLSSSESTSTKTFFEHRTVRSQRKTPRQWGKNEFEWWLISNLFQSLLYLPPSPAASFAFLVLQLYGQPSLVVTAWKGHDWSFLGWPWSQILGPEADSSGLGL